MSSNRTARSTQRCAPFIHLEPEQHGAVPEVTGFWGLPAGTSLQPPEVLEFLCCLQGLPGAAVKGNSAAKCDGFISEVIHLMAF